MFIKKIDIFVCLHPGFCIQTINTTTLDVCNQKLDENRTNIINNFCYEKVILSHFCVCGNLFFITSSFK